ncbi:MAG: hypothetical protein JWL89_538 [Candidatus Saccharibacteria bacterium]|nr:hypothetical protein [Candidatus Saccharibacteria bacterium]
MMGGRMEPDTSDDDRYIAAIKSAIDHGVTHIDTAEVYGGGHTEKLVGEAIAGYDRSKLFITTKLKSSTTGGYNAVIEACEASLERLGVDHVEMYLLHAYPKTGEPVEEIMRAMDALMDHGLVKNIGVCNMTVDRFEHLQNLSNYNLVTNQVHYSVQMREPEARGLTEHAVQNDYFITAWGSLEKGLLEQGDTLKELAKKYNKTPYQVALNWVIAQPNVITIPKTTSVEHLEENLGALGWELEPEDLEKLNKDFPNQKTASDRVPLDYAADFPA